MGGISNLVKSRALWMKGLLEELHRYNLDMFEHYKVELDALYFALDDGCNGLTKSSSKFTNEKIKKHV